MISLRETLIVRLEIDFEVLKGELSILERNALEHPLERLVVMWSDQIKQARLVALMRKLEKHGGNNKNRKRKDSDMG